MRHLSLFVVLVSCGLVFSACSDNTNTSVDSESNATVPATLIEPMPAVSEQPQEQEKEEKKSKAAGLLDMANKILDKVDSESEEAKKAKEWMNDKFGGESGGESFIPEDAAKWAADAFGKLKEKGMTTASNPSEWLKEDIRNMNALKYKIVKVSLDDLEALEDQLNKMGQLKWDCFHVAEKGDETILFFKKEKRSILKNIPVRDMMKLVPLMGNGDN